MTTYYYGIVEFGHFKIDEDLYPMAVIRRVDQVKEFDQPAEAWQYWEESDLDSYVGANALDEDGTPYEIVFKGHQT